MAAPSIQISYNDSEIKIFWDFDPTTLYPAINLYWSSDPTMFGETLVVSYILNSPDATYSNRSVFYKFKREVIGLTNDSDFYLRLKGVLVNGLEDAANPGETRYIPSLADQVSMLNSVQIQGYDYTNDIWRSVGVSTDGSMGSTGGSGGSGGVTGFQGLTGFQGVTGGVGIYFGNQLPMGLPTDGSFSDGIFPWEASTLVTNGLDDVNEILLAIAPTPPGVLTSSLVLSSTTKYSAILPTGLTAEWYQNGVVAGNTVTDYVIDNTYNLSNANPTTTFKCGSTFGGDEGTVYHVLDGVDDSFRSILSGVGITGNIQITSIVIYNTIWRKANAQINYTQTSEGFKRHAMRYQTATVNQLTSDSLFWYDNVNATPGVTTPTVTQNTLSSSRYLSGIRYYGTGDTFDSSSTITNIANKAIRPTNPISYVMSGINSTNIAIAGATFAYNDSYAFSPLITISLSNVYSIDSRLTVTGTKPNGATASSTSISQNRLLNTYSVGYSSNGTITMFDEEYRWKLSNDFSLIPVGYSDPTGDWVSSDALTNGNGQLYNSTWYYPLINYTTGYLPAQGVSTDYSAFSGDQVIVWASNIGVAHSSMRITFTGILYTNISAVGSGNLNIEVRLPSETVWLDCGRSFGDGNGCRNDGSCSGGILSLTFGTATSTNSNGVVFIKVTLRNSSAAKASQMVIVGL
jgi:hypothetical protein